VRLAVNAFKLPLKQADFLKDKIRVLKGFNFSHAGFKPRHGWSPCVNFPLGLCWIQKGGMDMILDPSYLEGASRDFEDALGLILNALSEEEQREYHFDCKQSHLFAVRIRVTRRMPDILSYLDSLFLSPQMLELPPLPCSGLREKGDFLLGCYWILEQANNNALDYHYYLLKAEDPPEAAHERAMLRFAASAVIGAQRHFLLWPWTDMGNPFYE
jgi:hypothetical protein